MLDSDEAGEGEGRGVERGGGEGGEGGREGGPPATAVQHSPNLRQSPAEPSASHVPCPL